MDKKTLISKAFEARKMAYAPYSNFKVGAALLTKNGKIYTGCNIENASYGATNCAERTAFFKAVSEGERDFEAIVIAGDIAAHDDVQSFAFPCGVCRQIMSEFCEAKDFLIIVAGPDGETKEFKLEELMPMGFGAKNLQ